jgi:hypothetical protein
VAEISFINPDIEAIFVFSFDILDTLQDSRIAVDI